MQSAIRTYLMYSVIILISILTFALQIKIHRNEDHPITNSSEHQPQGLSITMKQSKSVRPSSLKKLSNAFRRMRHRYDPIKEIPLSRRTKFVHHALSWTGNRMIPKWNGLVTKSMIFEGEIIFVENPLLLFAAESESSARGTQFMNAVQRKIKYDVEFSRIWSSEQVQEQSLPLVELNSVVGFSRKWYGVFQLLSRIQFGPKPNVAVMFGGRKDDYVCVVMAIADIEGGSKLMLSSSTLSTDDQAIITVDGVSTNLKQLIPATMQEFIGSEEIFKVLKGENKMNPPESTGQRFVQWTACLRHRRLSSLKWRSWCKNLE